MTLGVVGQRAVMEEANYLGISTAERNQFVYRIISVERLLQLFGTKQNVLVKPKEWEDPFENFILQSPVQIQTGEIATFGFRDQFYGQCWTLHSASDAMWRIYSPKKEAVRIRSTIRGLANSLSRTLGNWAHLKAFIGKVRYLPNKQLIAYANSVFRGVWIPSSKLFADTLLVKRPAFKHEREVRLLFFQHDENLATCNRFAYPVDPHTFVDQIMIDPRMSEKEYGELKAKVQGETGYRGPIKRSLLYAAPPAMVLPFGETPNPALHGTRDKAARP
jgi:hypothetical protein